MRWDPELHWRIHGDDPGVFCMCWEDFLQSFTKLLCANSSEDFSFVRICPFAKFCPFKGCLNLTISHYKPSFFFLKEWPGAESIWISLAPTEDSCLPSWR